MGLTQIRDFEFYFICLPSFKICSQIVFHINPDKVGINRPIVDLFNVPTVKQLALTGITTKFLQVKTFFCFVFDFTVILVILSFFPSSLFVLDFSKFPLLLQLK